jgi:hypothetical protein
MTLDERTPLEHSRFILNDPSAVRILHLLHHLDQRRCYHRHQSPSFPTRITRRARLIPLRNHIHRRWGHHGTDPGSTARTRTMIRRWRHLIIHGRMAGPMLRIVWRAREEAICPRRQQRF